MINKTTIKEDLAWLMDNSLKQRFSDSSLARSRKPSAYNSESYPQIALLAPRTHAAQPYNEREVIFTNEPAYVTVKLSEGWEAMLKTHYDERILLDKGPVHRYNGWVRKIVEPIYAAVRRQRRKY